MYEIPWIGIIGVLVGFVVPSILYIRTYEKRHKKNQRGDIDLTRLAVIFARG